MAVSPSDKNQDLCLALASAHHSYQRTEVGGNKKTKRKKIQMEPAHM